MSDQRFPEAELNRLWNQLHHAQPDGNGAAPDLEPETLETLRQLSTMARRPPPARARLRLDLAFREELAASRNGHVAPSWFGEAVNLGPDLSNGRIVPAPMEAIRPTMPSTVARGGWSLAQFATAMLLLVTLGLGAVTVGPIRRATERLAGVPAALLAPEAPASGVASEEILLEIALPAEAIPHGNRVSGSMTHFSLAPGTETTWAGAAAGCCPGFRLVYVLEGTFALRPASPARVFRAGTSLAPEVTAAGQDVTLQVGDAVMLPYQDAFDSGNPGAQPAHFLEIAFIDGFFQLHADGPRWERHFDADIAYGLSVPDRPATLRLQRRDLAPGAVLDPPPGAITQLGLTLADNAPLDVHNTDAIGNMNDAPVTVHSAALMPESSGLEAAASEPVLETVFAATLPAKMIPTAGNLDFLLWNVRLDAGAEGPASSQAWPQTRTCCPGPMMTHVIAGELSVRVNGRLQVLRGSVGAPGAGDVPPGTEVTLSPGDTAVFSYELPATFANRGVDDVHLVGGGIFAGAVRSGPAAMSEYLDYNEEYSVPQLPPGAVEAALVRAMLPPDGEVPAPPPGALVLEVGANGDADIAQRADGGLRNIGPNVETIYVLTLVPTGDLDTGHTP